MTIHLIGLEELETRYTKEWSTHFPKVLWAAGLEVDDSYYGEELETSVSDGTSFLNWVSTNYFKASQCMKIAQAIHENRIKDGDVILFTDFWNPVILQTRYMLEMIGRDVKIAGIAHAGAYDRHDQLAKRTNESDWIWSTEDALGNACDVLFFATEFHRELYESRRMCYRSKVAGFPMEYIPKLAAPYLKDSKDDLILFTQRNAPEKQPHMFVELEEVLKSRGCNYSFVNVQALKANKEQYHSFLCSAKLVVSFALQETLGITPYEALAFGCDILVPDRLSYTEMYSSDFKYASDATIEEIADRVQYKMKHRDISKITDEFEDVSWYFNSQLMIETLKELQK